MSRGMNPFTNFWQTGGHERIGIASSFGEAMTPRRAALAAAALAALAALGMLALPGALLENLVMASGLPAVLPAAEPPLGGTARGLLAVLAALAAAGAVGVVAGAFATLRGGASDPALSLDAFDRPAPTIRRADAHPDAPPRAPLLAMRDLGTPFLEVGSPAVNDRDPPAAAAPPRVAIVEERALPADLDTPLAAFDPAAIPRVPRPAPAPVPPLRRPPPPPVFARDERFETFELVPPMPNSTPHSPSTPAAAPSPESEPSVQALLERLERGIARKAAPAPAPEPAPRTPEQGLEEALASLRKLAIRA